MQNTEYIFWCSSRFMPFFRLDGAPQTMALHIWRTYTNKWCSESTLAMLTDANNQGRRSIAFVDRKQNKQKNKKNKNSYLVFNEIWIVLCKW